MLSLKKTLVLCSEKKDMLPIPQIIKLDLYSVVLLLHADDIWDQVQAIT